MWGRVMRIPMGVSFQWWLTDVYGFLKGEIRYASALILVLTVFRVNLVSTRGYALILWRWC